MSKKYYWLIDIVKKLGMDPAIVNTISHCCLAISSKGDIDTFVNVADNALEKGIQLKSLPPSIIVRLANVNNFQYDNRFFTTNQYVIIYCISNLIYIDKYVCM